jgi:hypothetical protein
MSPPRFLPDGQQAFFQTATCCFQASPSTQSPILSAC